MNPLLKKHIQGSLFFLFVAVFGALLILLSFKSGLEHEISNFYYLLEGDLMTYFHFDLAYSYGSSFYKAFIIFMICLFIYAIYSFFDEKNTAVGDFIGFIPVNKKSAYFYKWISGVLFLAATFVVVCFVSAFLFIYFNNDIESVYSYYNNIIESYQRQNEIFYSLADYIVNIYLYLFFIFCVCLLAFSFILFAFSAFGKIIHAVAFMFSLVVFAFSVVFIASYFEYFPIPMDVVNAPQRQAVFFHPVCDAIMYFVNNVRRIMSMRSINYSVTIYELRDNSNTLSELYVLTKSSFLIGIVICAAGSALFFWLGRKIYSSSEISRTDNVFMSNSLKKPALIYACVFGFVFLAMLAVIVIDTTSGY